MRLTIVPWENDSSSPRFDIERQAEQAVEKEFSQPAPSPLSPLTGGERILGMKPR